jgi:uncharacterized protein
MKTKLVIGLLAIFSTTAVYADGIRGHRHGHAWGWGESWINPVWIDDPVVQEITQPQIVYAPPAPGYAPGAAAQPAQRYWYFCAAADAYYPYVSSCPGGWQAVSLDAHVGLDKGMAAYNKQNFATAFREWRPLANIGNAMAQFSLGMLYAKGQGVPQDDKEAVKWFRLAADQGRADAQNNLGAMYENGQGVPQDDKEAVKWFRLAADQGYAYAQFNIGDMYANGLGVPQDDKEAVKWYQLAANQGDADAQNSLGEMYANGKGIQQNRVIAYALYSLSASNAPSADGEAAANLKELSSSMAPAEIAAGQSLLLEMKKPGMLLKTLNKYSDKPDV